MKIFFNKYLIIILLFIYGCQTHRIENTYDEQTKSIVSVLRNVKLNSDSYIRNPRLSVMKIDDKIFAVWIKYEHVNHLPGVDPIPAKQSQIIVKKFIKNILQNKQQLNGKYFQYQDVLSDYYYKHFDGVSKLPFDDVKILYRIWPPHVNKNGFSTPIDVNQNAVYFLISQDDYLEILQSDKVEILVETNFQPLTFKLDQESLKPLIEFTKHL